MYPLNTDKKKNHISRPIRRFLSRSRLTVARRYRAIRGLPAQTSMDISIFKRLLESYEADCLRIFEWGSGRSTIYYSKFLRSLGRDFRWYTVDNSKTWFEHCQIMVAGSGLEDYVTAYNSDFPPFWDLPGYTFDNPLPPEAVNSSDPVAEYVECPRKVGRQFDIVFIDGRYRRRCLLVAKDILAEAGTVILHDAQREHYLSPLAEYSQVQMLETGKLGGTSQKLSIALCSLDEKSPASRVASMYRSR